MDDNEIPMQCSRRVSTKHMLNIQMEGWTSLAQSTDEAVVLTQKLWQLYFRSIFKTNLKEAPRDLEE